MGDKDVNGLMSAKTKARDKREKIQLYLQHVGGNFKDDGILVSKWLKCPNQSKEPIPLKWQK